jgi:hypothetical protein
VDDTADRVVPLRVVLLPRATKSPLGRNEVELEIAGVVDPTQTSEVCLLIGVVGGTRICSYEGADVIFGAGLDAVLGFVAGLVAVLGFLAGLGGAFLGVVVALRVTLLCKHEMSLCIVRTSSSLSFASGVSPRRSRELSASISQMSVNSYLSGRCQSMSETQCQRLNIRDLMSETQCQKLNVRDSMSETQCQRLTVRDSISELDLLTWSRVFATPCTSVYNLLLVYKGIVDLSCLVFYPWTAARPSVNADRLLTASMSWGVFFSTEVQISLVQFETAVGDLRGTRGGAIMIDVRRI